MSASVHRIIISIIGANLDIFLIDFLVVLYERRDILSTLREEAGVWTLTHVLHHEVASLVKLVELVGPHVEDPAKRIRLGLHMGGSARRATFSVGLRVEGREGLQAHSSQVILAVSWWSEQFLLAEPLHDYISHLGGFNGGFDSLIHDRCWTKLKSIRCL